MDDVTITLVCPAEKRVIGRVTGEPGAKVNRRHLSRNFEPTHHADHLMERTAMFDASANGRMLTCPRCGNALVGGLDGQPIESVIKDDLRLICGFFKIPDGRGKRYKKGKPTPNLCRAVDVTEEAE